MALSFLFHPACHGSIPFFSAPFDDSQEAEGKERLALFSAFPKSFDLQPEGCGLYCSILIGDFLMPAVLAVSIIQSS